MQELRLGPSENLTREEMRARRLQALTRSTGSDATPSTTYNFNTSEKTANEKQHGTLGGQSPPPPSKPAAEADYDDDGTSTCSSPLTRLILLFLVEMTDVHVSEEQLEADQALARRLQEAEYGDDSDVEVLQRAVRRVIDVDDDLSPPQSSRGRRWEATPIDISDDDVDDMDEQRPSPRSLLQRIGDITSSFRRVLADI